MSYRSWARAPQATHVDLGFLALHSCFDGATEGSKTAKYFRHAALTSLALRFYTSARGSKQC